jgi:hypothetical protein
MHRIVIPALLLIGVLLNACGSTSTPPANPTIPGPALAPSPTIAAAPTRIPAAVPAPAPTILPATSTPRPLPTDAPQAIFQYLWPVYLPEGLALSPGESRVAKVGEVGASAAGFYLITFNGDQKRKLIVGGGAVEPLRISGDMREVTIGQQKARLTSSGNQRVLSFVTASGQGSLFLFSSNISESELLLIAEALLPIDQADLLARVGGN